MPTTALRRQLPEPVYVRVPLHRLTRADATRSQLFNARSSDGVAVFPATELARYPAPREALAYVRVECADEIGTLRPGEVLLVDREAARIAGRAFYLLRVDGAVQLREARRCPATGGLELFAVAGLHLACEVAGHIIVPFPQVARVQVLGRALAQVRSLA
jgi:hypothetical protein